MPIVLTNMTLVRPQVIVAMTDPRPAPRYKMATASMQLVTRGDVVWAKRAAWLRNIPFTADPYSAHEGQLETRIHFGDIAHRALGRSKREAAYQGSVLPPAAQEVKKGMKDYRARLRMDPSKYPSRLMHSLGGVIPDRSIAAGAADLRAILENKLKKASAAPAAAAM